MAKNKPVVALVGSGSLIGRELLDLLSGGPWHTRLIGAEESDANVLAEAGGEAVVLTALDEENLGGARMVFLAGTRESSRKALEILSRIQGAPPALVDLTGELEERPGTYLRAPMVEPANYSMPPAAAHAIAHPAAIALALLLTRLARIAPIRRSVAQIFEPASERGKQGITELEKQTTSLLTFAPLPKSVYDEQVAFNMLAAWGSDAPEPLDGVERRIERHLATLLGLHGKVPLPSVRLIQAPVFHGYSVSLWVEFETNPGREALERSLQSAQIDVRGPDLDPPTNVGIAGQSGIAVGAITADRNEPRAAWIWMVADNLRVAAENGVAVAREIAAQPGMARPQ